MLRGLVRTGMVSLPVFCLSLLCACASTTQLTEGKGSVDLLLVNSQTTEEQFKAGSSTELDQAKERAIARLCGVQKDPKAAVVETVMVFVVGKLIEFFVDQIDKALQEEVKKYVAAYGKSEDGLLYKNINNGNPELEIQCFRFVRGEGSEKKGAPVFDLVGQIQLTPNKDALQVRPLRLYYQQAKAKGEKVGASVNISASSVWRQNNEGKNSKIFEQEIHKEEYDFTTDVPKVVYFLDKGWDEYPILPIVPWSTNLGPRTNAGYLSFEVTVAEVGNLPWLLENAAALFSKEKDSISKQLKSALEEVISGKPE